jgi:hypothetical protein
VSRLPSRVAAVDACRRALAGGSLLAAAAAASCGANEQLAPTSAPIAPADFVAAYTGAVCALAARCDAEAPYLFEVCKAERAAGLGDVAAAVRAGRIAYNADLARRCVNGIARTPCLARRFDDATRAACFAAVAGAVRPGGACSSLFECSEGFCGGQGGKCPETCPSTLREGEACSQIFGPACDARAGLACSGGRCVRPAGDDAPCVDNNGCASGFVCLPPKAGAPATCQPLLEEHAPCSIDASCADGLYCNGDDEGGTCGARGSVGEVCGKNLEVIDAALRGVACKDGLVCKGAALTTVGKVRAGRCALPAALGEACEASAADAQMHISGCQTGLTCPAGTCALPPTSGACAAFGFCRPGAAYCAEDNTCAKVKPDGAPCGRDAECEGGTCRDASVCAHAATFCPQP